MGSEAVVPRAEGLVRNGGVIAGECGVSFWGDENVAQLTVVMGA